MQKFKSAIKISMVTTIVIMGVSILFLFYNQIEFANKYKKTVLSKNQAILDLSSASIDKLFAQSMGLTNMFLLDLNINEFMYQEKVVEGSSKIQTVIDTMANISNYKITNNGIAEIFLYSKKSDYLLSSKNAYMNIEMSYPLYSFDNLNARQWMTKYLKTYTPNMSIFPKTKVTLDNTTRFVIPLVTGYPLNTYKQDDGKVLILIDDNIISTMLANLKLGKNGFAILVDKKGQILSTYNRKDIPLNYVPGMNINGSIIGLDKKEYILLSSIGAETQLKLIIGMARDEFKDYEHIPFLIAAMVFIILILASSWYTFSMLRRQNIAWKKLRHLAKTDSDLTYEDTVKLIEEISKDADEQVIESGNNTYLTETVFRRFIHEKDFSLENLKQGFFRNSFSEEEIKAYTLLKICITDTFDYTNSNDINFLRLLVEKQFNSYFSGDYYIYMDLSYNLWCFVSNESYQTLLTLLKDYGAEIQKLSPFNLLIIQSSFVETFKEVTTLPHQINSLSSLLLEERESGLVLYSDYLTEGVSLHTYNKEVESKLLAFTSTGQGDEIVELFNKLYKENFIDVKLSIDSYKWLLDSLYSSAVLYCSRMDKTQLPSKFTSVSSAKDFFLKESGPCVCQKDSAEQKLINQIIEYISKNFSDVALNLSIMASDMNIKENYIYHFMLTRIGQSFSAYLENYRMNKAIEIFNQNPELQVNDVALMSGYNNPQTFRRVFKKHFGVLPGDYRISKLT